MPVSFCSISKKSIMCLIKCFSRFTRLRIEPFTCNCSLFLVCIPVVRTSFTKYGKSMVLHEFGKFLHGFVDCRPLNCLHRKGQTDLQNASRYAIHINNVSCYFITILDHIESRQLHTVYRKFIELATTDPFALFIDVS